MISFRKLFLALARAVAVVLPLLACAIVLSLITELHTHGISLLGFLTQPGIAQEFWPRIVRDVSPSLVAMVLAYALAAQFVRSLYRLEKLSHGSSFLWRSRFGSAVSKPLLVLKEGRIDQDRGQDQVLRRLGGPGNLVIYQDSAAVLERAGQLTRVERASLAPLRSFEKVYAVIDLRPKRALHKVEAMTREGIRVGCQADISYQIRGASQPPSPNGNGQAGHGARTAYRMLGSQVARAATSTWRFEDRTGESQDLTWENLVSFPYTDVILRRILARHSLDQLVSPEGLPHARQEIQRELERELRSAVRELGVDILSANLGDIVVHDDIITQWIAAWRSEREGEMMVRLAEGDAERLAQIEAAQAQAQTEMILELVHGLQSMAAGEGAVQGRLRLLRIVALLRHAAHDPLMQPYLPADTLRTLGALQDVAEGAIQAEG